MELKEEEIKDISSISKAFLKHRMMTKKIQSRGEDETHVAIEKLDVEITNIFAKDIQRAKEISELDEKVREVENQEDQLEVKKNDDIAVVAEDIGEQLEKVELKIEQA